jgi:hypothetical protein
LSVGDHQAEIRAAGREDLEFVRLAEQIREIVEQISGLGGLIRLRPHIAEEWRIQNLRRTRRLGWPGWWMGWCSPIPVPNQLVRVIRRDEVPAVAGNDAGAAHGLLAASNVSNLFAQRSDGIAVHLQCSHRIAAVLNQRPGQRFGFLDDSLVDRVLPHIIKRNFKLMKIIESGHVGGSASDRELLDAVLHIVRRGAARTAEDFIVLGCDDRIDEPPDELRQILRERDRLISVGRDVSIGKRT